MPRFEAQYISPCNHLLSPKYRIGEALVPFVQRTRPEKADSGSGHRAVVRLFSFYRDRSTSWVWRRFSSYVHRTIRYFPVRVGDFPDHRSSPGAPEASLHRARGMLDGDSYFYTGGVSFLASSAGLPPGIFVLKSSGRLAPSHARG